MIYWNWFCAWSIVTVTGYDIGTTRIAVKTIVVRSVFKDEGSCLILNCTCTSEIKGTWVGPRKSMTEKSNDDEMVYTEGSVLNPSLNANNVNFFYNISTGECNLEIANFSRVDEGTYKCQNVKVLQTIVYVFKVFVQNSPTVTVTSNMKNGTLNLQCNPSGVTNNYTFLRLEHRSEFNEHVRFMNTSNNGSVLHTSITNAGLQDTGIYVCNISKGVTDQNETEFHSGKTLVVFEGAPVHLGGDISKFAKIGDVIFISTFVYNGHGIRIIDATIQSKRKIINNLKITRSFVSVRKLFHGSNITLNTSQVSFQLDLITKKYFAKYILKICNKYGCTDIKINIRTISSKNQGSTKGRYKDVEIVVTAFAGFSVLGIGMAVVFLIRKRANDKDKSTLSQTEDLGEDTQGQSVGNRLYHSGEIVNLDNHEHVLQAEANGGYVYHAIASSSQAEPTRNDQCYLHGSHLNYTEVVFQAEPSSNSNIIHGANDKTIYSEIDLVQSTSFNNEGSDTSSDDDFIYIDGIVNIEKK